MIGKEEDGTHLFVSQFFPDCLGGAVLAIVVWIGGMFFAHYCLRPAAAEKLSPEQRLPLLVKTRRRISLPSH